MSECWVRRGFAADEAGAGTLWWIVWMIGFLALGGVAVDSSSAYRMRAELQSTADAAAHAAVIDLPDRFKAAAAAESAAQRNMDAALHGDVLAALDIEFGTWDAVGKIFAPAPVGVPADAVRVTTRRDAQNANRLRTYFLRIVGIDSWNVSARAVAQRYYPECLQKSAIVAAKVVDFQSNNTFYPGICIHANHHVEINNGNVWNPGVTVTMPSLGDFVMPGSNPDVHNPGIKNALGEEWFYPKIIDQVGDFLASYTDAADPMGVWPDYIGKDKDGLALLSDPIPPICAGGGPNKVCTGGLPGGLPVAGAALIKKIDAADWSIDDYKQGYIYNINCKQASNTVTLGATAAKPLYKVVVIANCNIKIGNNGLVHNAVIGSTAGLDPKIKPGDQIIHLGQGTQLGLNDNCAPGNGVKVLSTASLNGPANTTYYGVQMLAAQEIHVAAKTSGVHGINVQARNVNWASNDTFGPNCGVVSDLLKAPYFRLVS